MFLQPGGNSTGNLTPPLRSLDGETASVNSSSNENDETSSAGTNKTGPSTGSYSNPGSVADTAKQICDGYRFSGLVNDKEFRGTPTETKDIFRNGKNDFQSLAAKLTNGSDSMKAWEAIDTAVWKMVYSYEKNHKNLRANRALAVLIVNNSQQPIQISRVQVLDGKNYTIIDGIHYDAVSQCMPAEKYSTAVVFAFGYLPTLVDLAHLRIKIFSSAGEIFVGTRMNRSELKLESGYSGGFYEKTVTDWWAKYVVVYH